MRCRILHVHSSRRWGPDEELCLRLIQTLAKRGHSNAVVCPPGSPLAKATENAGLRVLPIAMRGFWDLPAVLELQKTFASRTIHILHAHTSLAAWLGHWSRNESLRGFVVSRATEERQGMTDRWVTNRADKVFHFSHNGAEATLERMSQEWEALYQKLMERVPVL